MNNENFNIAPNDENEEFTVEFGEVINDGGTHDYNELDNQPQINGHTLEGNKTNEQLGIPVYSAGENITISDDYVISATGGGGGGAVSSVNGYTGDVVLTTSDLENTSDYQTGAQVQNAIAGKQDKLTAGTNIQINNNTISATDTTYSDFTGTDGTAAGTAGLVPAPLTTDTGKFLKADGTWDTAGGSSVNVVQTTGTSQTDVMSQNATTSMVYADPSTKITVKIGDNASTSTWGSAVAVGRDARVTHHQTVAIGYGATALGRGAIALGAGASADAGTMNIGAYNTTYGYNSSNYRLLTGLYDPQSVHDAATKGYVDNSLLGKANKISVVQTSASTIEINPNTFYKFGEVASLTITLASITDNTIYNEYMFEFVSGTTATTLTLPSSIKWLETPTIDANKIYQCSIVDNIGILVGVANV